MKDIFCSLLASVFFVTSKGQCSLSSQDTGSLVSRCDTSVYKDLVIHIDFYKINSSCSCTLSPMFTGYLFVLLKESSAEDCNTQVKINNAFMFNCTVPAGSNHTLNVVQSNQVVRVQAEYTQPSKQGTFHQCLEFRQYGGNGGDLSITCAAPVPSTALSTSTTRSTTTTPSKTTILTSTTSLTTTPLKSTITTTTPSTHSRLTSFIVPSKEATVTINMNTDVITSSRETTSASFISSTMKITPDDSQDVIYIIAGFAAGGVMILSGLIICILALMKREKFKRNNDKSTEEESAPTNEIVDLSNALIENLLYVSSDEVDVKYTEEEKQQVERNSFATDSKTRLERNRNLDDAPFSYQPTDSVSVFPVPNDSSISHPEIGRRDVYAQVYKPKKVLHRFLTVCKHKTKMASFTLKLKQEQTDENENEKIDFMLNLENL